MSRQIRLFLAGDVMTGRRVDQALSAPGALERFEDTGNAIWADALKELADRVPEVRIVNLETCITTSDEAWPNKRFHFRMNPQNADCLLQANFDCCVLANNHVLDFGYDGMAETLETLSKRRIAHCGAGDNLETAVAPARLELTDGLRVLVFSWSHPSSFTPREWAAGSDRAGINLLPDYSPDTVEAIRRQIALQRQAGDLIVASLHWGPNWGYEVRYQQRRFAHALVDIAGVDVVHGHSSHHPIAVELYRGKPILYGCGDLMNDYLHTAENARYRPDLAAMYFLSIDSASKCLSRMTLVPMRIDECRLRRVSSPDAQWLCTALNCGGPAVGIRSRLRRMRHLRRTRFRNRWLLQRDGTLEFDVRR